MVVRLAQWLVNTSHLGDLGSRDREHVNLVDGHHTGHVGLCPGITISPETNDCTTIKQLQVG
ncbi:hypothetical protein DPMN_017227 [Dreissena polymorpha]|uniref:Uncharacterized protein n=1 Tax=Dreissena polymorpha TaxID=45954 RepID=A0A9D4S590_DREPO|nr:hypothetical protein DPMN_017227 [Dreissena polymorpha]